MPGVTSADLEKIATFPFIVASWVGDDPHTDW